MSNNAIAKSPQLGAEQGIGKDKTAVILRYRLDGTRCGMVQGQHAAWNYAYKVRFPDGTEVDMGRGLTSARRMAACGAEYVTYSWETTSFRRGPKGGLKQIDAI